MEKETQQPEEISNGQIKSKKIGMKVRIQSLPFANNRWQGDLYEAGELKQRMKMRKTGGRRPLFILRSSSNIRYCPRQSGSVFAFSLFLPSPDDLFPNYPRLFLVFYPYHPSPPGSINFSAKSINYRQELWRNDTRDLVRLSLDSASPLVERKRKKK